MRGCIYMSKNPDLHQEGSHCPQSSPDTQRGSPSLVQLYSSASAPRPPPTILNCFLAIKTPLNWSVCYESLTFFLAQLGTLVPFWEMGENSSETFHLKKIEWLFCSPIAFATAWSLSSLSALLKWPGKGVKCSSRMLKQLNVHTTGSWRLESLNPAELNPPGHASFKRLGDMCMCVYIYVYMYVCSDAQSRVTLCNTMDCSLPGSSVHGILQERKLEWAATSFSRGWSRPRDQTHVS